MTQLSSEELQKMEKEELLLDLDDEERERRVREFLPFIKYQAIRVSRRLPYSVNAEDLMHSGVLGLLDALDKYDPGKGVKLKTYAEFRIRGAILDEVRSMDWASRSIREKMKRLDEAYAYLERELKRPPTEEEMAGAMGLEMEQYQNLVREARGVGLVSLEDLFPSDTKDPMELLTLEEGGDPHDEYILKEMRSKVLECLDSLPKKEQTVLSLYYYEELTMKEIGLVMGVTESRVSQIHSKALELLKGRLRKIWNP